ncbi:beta-ketoacyl synthase [Nocardia sp. NPDC050718]|uniref:beta-ketoacyl synthase n=1 Tax=Nocardia sp. NPDC050718 TaxID=3155788 RepID=UPI00340C532A
MTVLDFDGIAFDPVGTVDARPVPQAPTPTAQAAPPAPTSEIVRYSAAPVTDSGLGPIGELRTGLVAAHRAALGAQVALQRALWERATGTAADTAAGDRQLALTSGTATSHTSRATFGAPDAAHPAGDGAALTGSRGSAAESARFPGNGQAGTGDHLPMTSAVAGIVAREGAFKPLARTGRTQLDRAALELLAQGAVAEVFGPGHQRDGVVQAVRLAAGEPLVLTEIESIELYGGTGDGRVVARYEGAPGAAARQAAEVFALFTGMHLGLSGSTLTGATPAVSGATRGTVELVVTGLDLVPRPHVAATASFAGGEPSVAVRVTVAEPAGAGVGPGQAVPGLLLNEFHMTHLARGDQAIAMGLEFAEYTGVRATRLPTGGLLLVDRVRDFDGARGTLDAASYTTEYDSPADSWYYADTANDSMPHFVYMETSLQAALLMGYYAGPTLTQPGVTLSLRNLGGTATVLRQVDLRDRTIEQSSRMLSTTILPGSSLQTFDYTLSVDGEPFYAGETMFGYFSDEALANQTGLDAGRPAPSWLAENPGAQVRTIDVAARRADPSAPLCSRRALTLIDRVEVVDGGGKHGAGYLHSLRAINPDDWFFARHFHLDPVIPGSLGVESVIHAVQEWLVDAGHTAGMTDPVFRIPADIAFSWRYRGQFLPTDGTVELEAHIKELRRGPHGVTAVVEGSLWKPGLRIYEVTDLAVELVDRGA